MCRSEKVDFANNHGESAGFQPMTISGNTPHRLKVAAASMRSLESPPMPLSPTPEPTPPESRPALLRHEAPTRTASQRQQALVRANQIRARRAALKRDLKVGERQLADVLQRPAEYTMTAKVHDLLVCVPGIGEVKAAKMLQQCRVSGSKTVGGLSDRQRAELVALLRR